MKAVVCRELKGIDALTVGDLPSPEIKPGHVRVRVKACALNFPDTLVVEGKYQFKPPLPFAPGSEFAGEVIELGPDVDKGLAGQAVFSNCISGGLAQEIVVPAKGLFPMPKGMPMEVAASLSLGHGTAIHALKQRAQLQPGETLLVMGAAGGVGLATVEVGKAMGARVIAAASSAAKLAITKDTGADETIDYGSADLGDAVKALTNKRGVDVVFDPVGGALSERAFRATAWKGRFLVIGFAGGVIPSIPLNLALVKGSSIVGVFLGRFTEEEPEENRRNIAQLVTWYQQGKIKPRITTLDGLERAAEGLHQIADRKVVGKLVVRIA